MQKNIILNNFFSLSRFSYFVFLFSILFSFFLFPTISFAAVLFLSPSTAHYQVGQTFSENILVNSSDQAINAVSGTVSYPRDLVDVVSLSKTGSIIKIWAEDPSFSSANGTVSFEGIVPSPGFQADNGLILTVIFKVKSIGDGVMSFSSASVLANDGQGTNILDGTKTAQISVGQAVPVSSAITQVKSSIVIPSIISSKTHPDQTLWYSNNNPVFSWSAPKDTTAVSFSLDTNSNATPIDIFSSSVSTKAYKKVADGVWYFHLRFKNASGWGNTFIYKVQIDTTPPVAMNIVFPHSNQSLDPRPIILFNTTDTLSGIDHYQIKIKDQDYFKVDSTVNSNPFTLPPQDPGPGTVLVEAFDKAGNSTVATADFTILGLDPPRFTDVPDVVSPGDILRVQGETYPTVVVYISLQDESGKIMTENTQSTVSGHFGIVWPKRLDSGLYTMTAWVVDSRNAKSGSSLPKTIQVKQSAVFYLGQLAVTYLSLILFILFLLGAILFTIFYFWHKAIMWRHRLEHNVHKTESEMHTVFDLLREDMEEHVKNLEHARTKRVLTHEEETIVISLKKNLTQAEQAISKDIKNIIRG